MDKEKLYNTLRRELNKNYGKKNVVKKHFSISMIRTLLNTYEVFESCITTYGKQENQVEWQDIEGEKSGWLFLGETPINAHKKLIKYILRILVKNKKHLYNRNIFYIENDTSILIIFPLRDNEFLLVGKFCQIILVKRVIPSLYSHIVRKGAIIVYT